MKFNQSGTKPNLVGKIWLPTLVTICNGLPKLVANISSHIDHLVNTGLAVGSLVKWLPISSTLVSDSHLSPPGALQSRRASLQ